MDPDETLRRIRELTGEDRTPIDMLEAQELVELCRALDDWLRKGGFLPSAWAR